MSSGKIKLGYILTKYRLKFNLTVSQLSLKISIPQEYIIALESGNYKLFKTLNQATPLLKKLSYVLGLKYSALAELYNKEYESYLTNQNNKLTDKRFVISQNFVKKTLFAIIALGIVSYLILQFYQLGYIPVIKVSNNAPYEIYNQDSYNLTGSVSGADYLTLNGQKVTLKEDGNFEVSVILKNGENRLELEAIKNNKSFSSIKKVIYKQ